MMGYPDPPWFEDFDESEPTTGNDYPEPAWFKDLSELTDVPASKIGLRAEPLPMLGLTRPVPRFAR